MYVAFHVPRLQKILKARNRSKRVIELKLHISKLLEVNLLALLSCIYFNKFIIFVDYIQMLICAMLSSPYV